MIFWNLIHGCHQKSEGCAHCFVFARDEENGIDTNVVRKTASFYSPLERNRKGDWKIPSGSMLMTCFSSDFFIEEMDVWRNEAWQMMQMREDLTFYMITKRPERISICLPPYWEKIKARIFVGCTMENQQRADERLVLFNATPLVHREIIVEPMLTPINFHGILSGIEKITVGGETGRGARPCHYEWILDLRRQCQEAGVGFYFMQTGGNFYKDGKNYRLPRHLQLAQAAKANINLPSYSAD